MAVSPLPAQPAHPIMLPASMCHGAACIQPMQHPTPQPAAASSAAAALRQPGAAGTFALRPESQHHAQIDSPAAVQHLMPPSSARMQHELSFPRNLQPAEAQSTGARTASGTLNPPSAARPAGRPDPPGAPASDAVLPAPRPAAEAGAAAWGGNPKLSQQQRDEAVRRGVLQSGSSEEELARALADLTQMISCARSDRSQCIAPGGPTLSAPPQHHAIPNHKCAERASAERQPSQPGRCDPCPPASSSSMSLPLSPNKPAQPSSDSDAHQRKAVSSPVAQKPPAPDEKLAPSTGVQIAALAQPSPPSAQMQNRVQADMPAASQHGRAGCQQDGKRKRDELDACTEPQRSQKPKALQEDMAPLAKRVKVDDGSLSLKEHCSSAVQRFQQQLNDEPTTAVCTDVQAGQDGILTALESPAEHSLGGHTLQAAGPQSLHALLR